MSSALLTIWKPEAYTIIDVRAVATLRAFGALPSGRGLPPYLVYLDICRSTAKRLDVSLRTLDKALGKYDQENG